MKNIVLASKSPRRRELLDMLGLKYIVTSVEVDEDITPDELPQAAVKRIASKKAQAAAETWNDCLIIAADTIVVCEGQILGKPANEEEAYKFLEKLSGKAHEVMTGLCLYNSANNYRDLEVVTTLVYFRSLTKDEINFYIASKEPFDKAGGYGIQDKGALLVSKIEGSYFNVVGLPVTTLYLMLKKLGIELLGG